jgi:hypothetical protein
MNDHLPMPVDHINLEAIDHLAGAVTDYQGVDPRGVVRAATGSCEPPFAPLLEVSAVAVHLHDVRVLSRVPVRRSEPAISVHSVET